MAGNSFGTLYRLTTFGESHGDSIGGIIDGCPSNIHLDLEKIQKELDRRKPGQSKITTTRKEEDKVEFYSGIFEGKTTGTPIGFRIPNKDYRSVDYSNIKDVFRPGHADLTYEKKYGHRDYRGGGRSSARETACRVVAGAIAQQVLEQVQIKVCAYVNRIADIEMKNIDSNYSEQQIESNIVRCPDSETATRMIERIEEVRAQGDSLGGSIRCVIQNAPIGLGEPVFDKLNADLAKAMVSINAVKSFEIGSGIQSTYAKGSENNDSMFDEDQEVKFKSNHAGGILGGISNGDAIVLTVGFKPVSTISKAQNTINADHKAVEISVSGRHDPCVVPRAVPIVQAMAAIVILDHYLRNKAISI